MSLIETIGLKAEVLPASATIKLGTKNTVLLESTDALRSRISDTQRTAALLEWAKVAKPEEGSDYYFIRETVATEKLKYVVENSWLAEAGLNVKALQQAGYTGQVKAAPNNRLEMDAIFSKSMNVWYKSEKIVFSKGMGGSPGSYAVTISSVKGINF